MSILITGVLLFFVVHLLPSFVSFRLKIINAIGERPYKSLYAVIALTGFILIIYGMSEAEFYPVWQPPVWGRYIVFLIMPVSFILLVANDLKSNIKCYTRHPMLWGVALWAGAHLFANGDLASIILFGSFFVFSLFAMFSANKRGAVKQEKRYPYKRDVVAVVAGLVGYVVFVKYLHAYLIGVAII